MYFTVMKRDKWGSDRKRSSSLPGWQDFPSMSPSFFISNGGRNNCGSSTPPARRKFAVKHFNNNNQNHNHCSTKYQTRRGSHVIIQADEGALYNPHRSKLVQSPIMVNPSEVSYFEGNHHPRRKHHNGSCCGGIKSRDCCWWEPDQEDTCDSVDFALETSLHGLKYMCQPKRHLIERFVLIIFDPQSQIRIEDGFKRIDLTDPF
jgi:hypothetical protein